MQILMTGGVSMMLVLLALMPTSVAARNSPPTNAADHAKGELVVLGKIERQEFIGVLDEFGMNSVMEADLRITRVESGHPPSSVLTIRYIAHSDLPEDRELRFRLRQTSDGIYLVCREGGRGYVCD